MSEPDAGTQARLYGVMQLLMSRMAQRVANEVPPWRGVVTQQDALDAVLQVAAVIDLATRSGQIPAAAGTHAGAMLMLVRDYVQPLPRGTETGSRDPVTADLDEIAAALREARDATGLQG